MKTRIIKIDNSQGIRIPKVLLEQTGLGEEVEFEAQGAQIIIRPTRRPRQGWDEAFRSMGGHEDDRLVDEDWIGQTAETRTSGSGGQALRHVTGQP